MAFLKNILFIYLRENKQGEQQREREKQPPPCPPLSKEPDAGLDPRTPGI